MKTIRQKAYWRQRIIKEVIKGRTVTEVARRHRISRTSIYRWMKRYNGTVESLYERSHRPHSHPKQQTIKELQLIKRVLSHNNQLGLVCLHMILEDRHGYARYVSSLYRAMKKMNIGIKKQRKRRHIPQPYDTLKVAGERVQIDVKYVPTKCLVEGCGKLYQFTAVDECTRLRRRLIFEEKSIQKQ